MVVQVEPEPDDDDGAWMRAEEWDEWDDEPTFEKWRRGQTWS
jgi:hypothetical protein